MNFLRAPILNDLAGFTLVVTVWLAALFAPVQAIEAYSDPVFAQYCGDGPINDPVAHDINCHACCMPQLILPVVDLALHVLATNPLFIAWPELAEKATISPFEDRSIRGPPVFVS